MSARDIAAFLRALHRAEIGSTKRHRAKRAETSRKPPPDELMEIEAAARRMGDSEGYDTDETHDTEAEAAEEVERVYALARTYLDHHLLDDRDVSIGEFVNDNWDTLWNVPDEMGTEQLIEHVDARNPLFRMIGAPAPQRRRLAQKRTKASRFRSGHVAAGGGRR